MVIRPPTPASGTEWSAIDLCGNPQEQWALWTSILLGTKALWDSQQVTGTAPNDTLTGFQHSGTTFSFHSGTPSVSTDLVRLGDVAALVDEAETALIGAGGTTVISGSNTITLSSEVDKALIGSDGITVTSGSNTNTLTGFRTEFVAASGSLQSQISAIVADEVEPALVGAGGTTVVSGSNQIQISSQIDKAIVGAGGNTVVSGSNQVQISGPNVPAVVSANALLVVTSGSNTLTLTPDTTPSFTSVDAATGTFSSSLTISGIPVPIAARVESVNGLTGAVVLAAGNNVTITPTGNTLTFASTAAGGGGSGNALVGAGGTTIVSGSNTITVSSQIDKAVVGAGGTTVISGANTVQISSETDKAILSDSALLVVTSGANSVTLSPDTTPSFTSVDATTGTFNTSLTISGSSVMHTGVTGVTISGANLTKGQLNFVGSRAGNVSIAGSTITFDAPPPGAGGGGSGINNVVEDTTPQLGGYLDANTFSIGNASQNNLIDFEDDTTVYAATGDANVYAVSGDAYLVTDAGVAYVSGGTAVSLISTVVTGTEFRTGGTVAAKNVIGVVISGSNEVGTPTLRLQGITTATRDTLPKDNGRMVFNTTTNLYEHYNTTSGTGPNWFPVTRTLGSNYFNITAQSFDVFDGGSGGFRVASNTAQHTIASGTIPGGLLQANNKVEGQVNMVLNNQSVSSRSWNIEFFLGSHRLDRFGWTVGAGVEEPIQVEFVLVGNNNHQRLMSQFFGYNDNNFSGCATASGSVDASVDQPFTVKIANPINLSTVEFIISDYHVGVIPAGHQQMLVEN